MQVQALWHCTSDTSRLAPVAIEPCAGGVYVKGLFSLISTGTERLVAQGRVPVELHDQMRVPFMRGDFSFPCTYGYSWVGRVEQPGHRWHGRIVQIMHPHQEAVIVPEVAVRLVPEDVPPLRATLAANVETALNGIWDARIWPGARVLVVGHGLIGALLTRLLTQIPAVEVYVVEPDVQRTARVPQPFCQVASVLPAQWRSRMDVAFHTSATDRGLQQALDSLVDEGTVVELSWYGTDRLSLHLGGRFHVGRQRIIASQVSRLPPFLPPAWSLSRRMEVVWKLLQQSWWDQLMPQIVPFAQAPGFFHRLRNNQLRGWAWAFAY